MDTREVWIPQVLKKAEYVSLSIDIGEQNDLSSERAN